MKLVDMFEMADRETLKKIAKNHHIKFDNIVWFHSDGDKNEPYSGLIYKKFSNDGYLDKFIEGLDKRYRDVLTNIFFGVFSIKNFNDYNTADSLRQMGLIYIEKDYGGIFCKMPDEIRRIFKNHINVDIISQKRIEPEPMPAYNMFKDMITVLFYIRNNVVKIKQNGEIFKKALERMATLVVVDNKEADINEYIIITLINSCSKLGIIYNDDNVLKVDFELFNAFMDMPYESKVNLMAALIVYRWFYSNSNDNAGNNIFRNLKALLDGKPGSINITLLFNMMRESGMSENEENIFRLRFIFLRYIGVINVEESDGNRFMIFQDVFSKQKNEVNIYIQPNYEIYLPPYVDLKVLYNILMYAEPVKMDKNISIYKLSKEYVLYSLRHGKAYKDIFDELTEISVELPQNVAYTLKDWSDLKDEAYYVDCILLRIKDADIAETIKSKIKNYIIMDISKTDFAIYKDKYALVNKILL